MRLVFLFFVMLGLSIWQWDWIANNSGQYIAILAFFVTFAQAYYAREHNRVSVRPFLTTFTTRQFATDPTGATILTYKASLMNCGLGPALIQDFTVLFNGIPQTINDPDDYKAMVSGHIAPLGASLSRQYFGLLRRHSVLRSQEDIIVADIDVPVTPGMNVAALGQLVEGYHLLVTFQSAYGETWIYDTRSHKQPCLSRLESIKHWVTSRFGQCSGWANK